ncbi:MAG: sensor domain-containing diguanylate cyclase [Acidobacteriota bacterium]
MDTSAFAPRRRHRTLRDPRVLADFVRNLQEGIYVTTADGRIRDANPAFLRMFGVSSLRQLRRFTAEQLLVDPARRAEELEILAREGAVREFELEIRRPDGEVRTVLDTAYQRVDEATGEVYYHGILIDITERKELERKLRDSAIRDALTGCYNRHYLHEQEHRLEASAVPWGVIVIDVDHFKEYNDRFGHHTGDRVLQGLARFLMNTVRTEDAVIRMGGDEFLILLHGSAALATEEVARRLSELGPGAAPVSFSQGWAVKSEGETLERTIRRADRQLIQVRVRERRYHPPRATH